MFCEYRVFNIPNSTFLVYGYCFSVLIVKFQNPQLALMVTWINRQEFWFLVVFPSKISGSTNARDLKLSSVVHLSKRWRYAKISSWPCVWSVFYTSVCKLPHNLKSQDLQAPFTSNLQQRFIIRKKAIGTILGCATLYRFVCEKCKIV